MGQAPEGPREDPNGTAVLDHDIPETELKALYVEIAQWMLQLAQPTFPRIGSLAEACPKSHRVM